MPDNDAEPKADDATGEAVIHQRYDRTYKRWLSYVRVMIDLLTVMATQNAALGKDFLDRLVLSTLAPAPTEYPSGDVNVRICDVAWTVDYRYGGANAASFHGTTPLLLMFQVQNRRNTRMSTRTFRTTAYALDWVEGPEYVREDTVPLMINVTVYTGKHGAWPKDRDVTDRMVDAGAPIAHFLPRCPYIVIDMSEFTDHALIEGNLFFALCVLETTRSVDRAKEVVQTMLGWLTGPGDASLAESLLTFVELGTIGRGGSGIAGNLDTVEGRNMIFDNVWEQARHEGIALGEQRGRQEGIALGEQRGRQAANALGARQMRNLVVGQVRRKFGSPTADSLSDSLDRGGDAERIVDVGNWLVECQTGEDLLRRVNGKV